MRRILAFITGNKSLFYSFLFLSIILGMTSYSWIKTRQFPKVNLGIIKVSVQKVGLSPEEALKKISIPFEKKIENIEDIKDITSYSFENGAVLIAELRNEAEVNTIAQEIKARVSKMITLDNPQNLLVEKLRQEDYMQSSVPILEVAVYEKEYTPKDTLKKATNILKNKLVAKKHINEVSIKDRRNYTIDIFLDLDKLEKYAIPVKNIEDVFHINSSFLFDIKNKNDGNFLNVKIQTGKNTLEQIKNTKVSSLDGKLYKITDIAEVVLNKKNIEDRRLFFNDKKAMFLRVKGNEKTYGKEMQNEVEETLKKLKETYQVGADIINSSEEIVTTQVSSLKSTIIQTTIVTLVILFVFLGLTGGILAALVIPLSFLYTIIILYYMGGNLNTITMFGMILSIGIIIDNAIVVTEYAHKNKDITNVTERYIKASEAMISPIFISSLTTIIAFLPLIFWPGIIGQIMSALPISFMLLLFFSVLVSIFMIPELCQIEAYLPQSTTRIQEQAGIIVEKIKTFYIGLYEKIAFAKSNNRIFLVIFSLLIIAVFLLSLKNIDYTLVKHEKEKGRGVDVEIKLRGNAQMSQKEKINFVKKDLYPKIRKIVNSLEHVKFAVENKKNAVTKMKIKLRKWNDNRNEKISDIITAISKEIGSSKFSIKFTQKRDLVKEQPDLAIIVSSRKTNINDLIAATKEICSFLGKDKDILKNTILSNIQSSNWLIEISPKKILPKDVFYEWQLISLIKLLTQEGKKIGDTSFKDIEEILQIRIKIKNIYKNINKIKTMRIPDKTGGYVPISSVFDLKIIRENTQTIIRKKHEQFFNIVAVLTDKEKNSGIMDSLEKWLEKKQKDDNLYKDINIKVDDKNIDDKKENLEFVVNAFLLSLIVMSLILIGYFSSVYQAFIIVSSIIISTTVVLFYIWMTHGSFEIIMTGLGIILLMGIVVNNNIIFINTYNILKKENTSTQDAIRETISLRLRPILLTTLTTVLGLLPAAFAVSFDLSNFSITIGDPSIEWFSELAKTVVIGLACTTPIILVITPSLICLQDN